MIYDMKDYWANPKIGEKQVVQDVDRDGNLTKRAEYLWSGAVDGKPVIRLDEYNEGRGWTDAWEYRFDDRGVLEVADWETGGTHKVFKQGLELNWGNKLEVGQGCYAAIISGKGRMQADLNIFRLQDEILLDFEPGLTATITERLIANL